MDQILCPKCGAVLTEQPDFDPTCDAWTCTECGRQLLSGSDGWVCTESGETADDSEKAPEEAPKLTKEERRAQKKAARREKRRAFRKKHWKGYLITVLGLIAAAAIAIAVWQYSKLTPMSISPEQVIGMSYPDVTARLEQSGFTNVSLVPLEDLSFDQLYSENQIVSVSVNGSTDFEEGAKFPYDCDILITYHSAKAVSIPFSASDAKKMSYEEVRQALLDAGFGHVWVTAHKDLIFGWLHKDGDVEQVLIDGQKKFKAGSSFRVDAEIEIIYHTFKKEK